MARLTPELETRLGATAPDQEMDLILEMTGEIPRPPSDRTSTEYVDTMREAFRQDTTSVHRLIEKIGGAVVGENWMNRAVKVRVLAERVSDLLDSPQISVIDVPHRLTRG